jgi:hypothetical protein
MSEPILKGHADGEAVIEGDYIVIRVRIDALPDVVQAAPAPRGLVNWRIVDPDAFAPHLLLELNYEDEVGCSPIHRMFDAAIGGAIEAAAPGVIEVVEEWNRSLSDG